jgi:lipoprotein-releasing system ATP-binding protein
MSLVARGLCKEYPTRSGPLVVLRDIDLDLDAGAALAVMGPSGSGKSTLLHILGTLERPTAGKITVDDRDPLALSERDLAVFRNQQIGFVFQDHHLLPQCSALENVLVPTLVQKEGGDAERRARHLLERVGLSGRVDHRPPELSGGERQRVAVARALINQPALLLADEPTGNLDRKAAQSIGSLLLDLVAQEQIMLIFVTHSQELAARFPERKELIDGTLSR